MTNINTNTDTNNTTNNSNNSNNTGNRIGIVIEEKREAISRAQAKIAELRAGIEQYRDEVNEHKRFLEKMSDLFGLEIKINERQTVKDKVLAILQNNRGRWVEIETIRNQINKVDFVNPKTLYVTLSKLKKDNTVKNLKSQRGKYKIAA